MSRLHARIERDDDDIIVDRGSTNGVFVNDERVINSRILRDGDRLEIGNMGNVTFDFRLRSPEPND